MRASAMASLLDTGRRQRERAYRIFKSQGAVELAWDATMVGLKPARARCEAFLWRLHQTKARDEVLRARVQGSKMYLNPDDVGISKELAIYKVHEPLSTRVLRQIVTEGMVVVDIGANIGYYVLIESKGVGSSGRVIAIEPVEANYTLLQRNIRLNSCENVTPVNVAIGDHTGIAKIYLSRKSNCHSIVQKGSADESSDVRIMTLDGLVEQQGLKTVDLLRMDIEGYEFVAIEGMIETIRAFRPMIFLEIHPHLKSLNEDAALGFVRRLKGLGYNVQCVIDRVRDVPLRSWMAPVEEMSIDDLLQDSRLTTHRRPISVLFRPGEDGATSESMDRREAAPVRVSA
jgi:FkbM family methyltransferase